MVSNASDLIGQLKAIRNGVGLYDASDSGQLLIEGPDSPGYLQRMFSNEVLTLKSNEGRYNAILDRKGMVLSLFHLIRMDTTKFLAVTPPQLTQKTREMLLKMKFLSKIIVKDESEERSLFLLIGPGSDAIIAKKFGVKKEGVLLWRETLFGPPLWNLSMPRDQMKAFRESLSLPEIECSAIRLMRMEVGFPEYGIDIDETHILLETTVPQAWQRQKGCYPGQEVIERILAYGKGRTPKRLCPLTIPGEQVILPKSEIFTPSGEKAGMVTSSLYNPLEKKTFVLAFLDHKFSLTEGASVLRQDQGRLVISI